MRIALIHGEDSIKSFARYRQIKEVVKKRGWEIKNFDESSQSTSLLGEKILFISENPKSLPKKLPPIDNFLIWCENPASKNLLKVLPKGAGIERFDYPKELFLFLSALYPSNGRRALEILKNLKKREPVELIFSLTGSTFRDLFWLQSGGEGLNYPPWRFGKLKRQASLFGKDKIKKIINLLAGADIDSKISKQSLSDSLDLIIRGELE